MRVLYIDVYFLINFTVDLLALYFSALLLHFSIHRWRLTLSAVIGASFAVVAVLLHDHTLPVLLLSILSLIGMIVLTGKGGRSLRRMRLALLFLLLQMLIGGIVHWGYRFLAERLKNLKIEGGIENRKLLYLSVLILLAIGILRISISLLSSHTGGAESREVEIVIAGKRFCGTALVDSGNLLRDPMDGSAVVLIKPCVARRLLPPAFLNEDVSALSEEYQKRLRLIPVRMVGVQRILFGIRPDSFFILKGKTKEPARVMIAYDKEEGDYGGYAVLIPSAVVDHV